MFTGLVETTAVLRSIRRRGAGARLDLGVSLDQVELGESISVSGACLTVCSVGAAGFEADVSAETLARSTLGELQPGARVNIERATRLGARMGGHIVTGHVDAVGTVARLDSRSEARRLQVLAPEPVQRYLAPKGSVTIDGVSLTVNRLVADGDRSGQGFEVMLVPHTLSHTTLHELSSGQRLNLEADILARYVARQLELAGLLTAGDRLARHGSAGDSAAATGGAHDADRPGGSDDGHRDEAILSKLREGGFMR